MSNKQLEKIQDLQGYDERVHAAAIWYIGQGIPVLPIIPNGKRLPASKTGISYHSASIVRKTIDKWFNHIDGLFVGYNIGIACGKAGGFFALDVDKHGAEDGEANLDRLMKAEDYKIPKGPVAQTPNKGKHYLFRWVEGASQGTSKIAKGVDSRGGPAEAYKSHIVVFPSIVDNKEYMWVAWPKSIPEVPDWMIAKLGELWKNSGNRGSEEVTEEDLEIQIDKSQILRMLKFCDPNDYDYDQWLKIGMAIKSQLPFDDGLEIWDGWSKGGARYSTGECYTRWSGFSEMGKIRAGTLFHYAIAGGWTKEKGDKKGNTFDRIVSEMNQEFAVILVGAKLRILWEKNSDIRNEHNFSLMDKESFVGYMSNKRIWVTTNGKPSQRLLSEIWLGHEGRRTYRNGLALFPNAQAPDGYFNTWSGFSVDPEKGNCTKFLDHLRVVICDGDQKIYEWLIDWVTDMVQDPANPKGCCVVMRGKEGSGKGVFADTIGSLFGPHYNHLINDTHLTSNFNAHMIDSIVAFMDEITWGGDKKNAGIMKGLVTEKYLMGERKFTDAAMYRNMNHVFIASNSDWVIPAGENSRRWMVVDVNNDFANDSSYFNALFKEIKEGGRAALLYYFLNRKIDNNLRYAIETKALHQQRILNVQNDTIFHWWRECIISNKIGVISLEGEFEDWPNRVLKMDLYSAYKQRTLNDKKRIVNESEFGKQLYEYGFISQRCRWKGGRIWVYDVPSTDIARIKLNSILSGAVEDE